MIKSLQIIAISLVLMLAATATINAQTASGPTLETITPSQDQTIYGNKIPILFNIENFEIVDFDVNKVPIAGQGHIHLWLDDENPTTDSATMIKEDNFTYSDVPFGNHTLVAELLSNNHKSLYPPQKVTINFINASISTPEAAATSGFDKNTALVILVVVALVIVAAWWYTKEEDEEENPPAGGKPKKKTVKRKTKKGK